MKCTIARYGYAKWTYNVHIYIYIEHRNLETQKHLRLLSSGTKLFITFEFKGSSTKERDTHSFYSVFFSSAHPTPSRATPAQGLREQAKVNRLLPRQDSTQLTDFFKSPKILRALPVSDVTRTPQLRFHLGLL